MSLVEKVTRKSMVIRPSGRSEESWKKHLESAKRARKKNPEKTILYNNYYRTIKGDLIIADARKKRAELSDSYIKQVIQKNLRDDGVYISRSEIPMDFIELKRKQLNIYRNVKNKKN
jgi:type II secretory pathway component PulC